MPLEVLGARGGTLLARAGHCPQGARLVWRDARGTVVADGERVDDPVPDEALTVTATCGDRRAGAVLAVRSVFSTSSAFAILREDGTVTAWGSPAAGGDMGGREPRGAIQIAASERAFAARGRDGGVVAWGDAAAGGDIGRPLSGIAGLYGLHRGFLARGADGRAHVWGSAIRPFDEDGNQDNLSDVLDAPALDALRNATHVVSSLGGHAVLKRDGRVAAFGDAQVGGDVSPVADDLSDVVRLVATDYSMAALLADGRAVVWGGVTDPGVHAGGLSGGVLSLASNSAVHALLHADGSVNVLGVGLLGRGEEISGVRGRLTAVRRIYASKTAFAALGHDGRVVGWGDDERIGESFREVEPRLRDVVSIASTETSFAALTRDGRVVTWGEARTGGDSRAVAPELTGVALLFANDYAFAALKTDGTVVTWGAAGEGGDSSSVRGMLRDVRAIHSTPLGGFVAIRRDGTLVAWGSASAGGVLPRSHASRVPHSVVNSLRSQYRS
ncbi:hypothetical protein GCM10011289_26860 [Paludibacterium paludis]|uniref:Alpha-tubulin suppressor-like RCC1 family protein n=1 Tax=Paludibacterium paludis TaxID=1225769 RepID=A0A918P5F1_9NEIS|nr:hypothetical protein GCM10011289_26860 [Paludibacterium paludis]